MNTEMDLFYRHHKEIGNYSTTEAVERWYAMSPRQKRVIVERHTITCEKLNDSEGQEDIDSDDSGTGAVGALACTDPSRGAGTG